MRLHSAQGPAGPAAGRRGIGRASQGRSAGARLGPKLPCAAAVEQAAPAPLSASDLPQSLRNATAVLRAPNGASVYVLGVSHVSAVSCDQVRELVAAVKPDTVVVELCKDRTAMLVDPETTPKAPDTWICTRVEFDGLPGTPAAARREAATAEADGGKGAPSEAERALAAAVWPTGADLAPLLRTRIGRIVTTSEVEGDVAALEATGLFSLVRPICEPGRRGDAPLFGAMKAEEGGLELEYVAPLGCTRMLVEPRKLPVIKSMTVRLDSSLKAAGVSQEALDAIAADTVAACAAETPRDPLLAYLVARRDLIALASGGSSGGDGSSSGGHGSGSSVVVDFSGVDTGVVEAVVRARRPGDADAPFVSGLEASAEGEGIDRFRPVKRGVQLSPRMSLPAEAAARMNALKAAKRAEASVTARGDADGSSSKPSFRFWRPDEVTPADFARPEASAGPDFLAAFLTGAYSGLQSRAGRAVGVSPGAAWRAAMQAATEHGAETVILGDRPAQVSQRRLADAMFPGTTARLSAALVALGASIAAAATHAAADAFGAALPGGDDAAGAAALAAGAAAAVGVAWPVLGPLVEVWRFSQLDGPAVEAAVAVREPIQSNLDRPLLFWGEDALLKWPGAWKPLIEERDAYMARVAAAAATGKPTGAPAYVAGEANGQLVWRYAMPAGGPEGSAPTGVGEGEYAPPAGGARSVVFVVGTAHVRGMCRAWEEALARPGDVGEFVTEATEGAAKGLAADAAERAAAIAGKSSA